VAVAVAAAVAAAVAVVVQRAGMDLPSSGCVSVPVATTFLLGTLRTLDASLLWDLLISLFWHG
jgi:hypothetical protein